MHLTDVQSSIKCNIGWSGYRVRFSDPTDFNISLSKIRRLDIYCGSQFIAVEHEWEG